ncbi:hypothetical protein [Flavobacterium sp.]|uniref:hypothetical protein n=1 Tax=Flavobacterium sp. TaxID=239 RepID=UPI0031E3DD93
MIDKVLTNLIYTLYPKKISFYRENEKYIATNEYQRLKQIISKFDSEFKEEFAGEILGYFQKDYTLKNFQDFTMFNLEDRCLTFNVTFIEDGEMYTISLLISILVPYYVIKCQKNIIDLYYTKSEIADLQQVNKETRRLKELLHEIETIVEEKMLFSKFPSSMLNIIVPNVSFQETEIGYFKMFNAFFNNLIMIDNEE